MNSMSPIKPRRLTSLYLWAALCHLYLLM